MLTPHELAMAAVKALEDKKGLEIKLLAISDISTLADHFLICTGGSNTHVNALCDAVDAELSNIGEPPLHREGHRSGSWVLLDFGCLVVHVFTEESRKFYDLERLWHDAKVVDFDAIISAKG